MPFSLHLVGADSNLRRTVTEVGRATSCFNGGRYVTGKLFTACLTRLPLRTCARDIGLCGHVLGLLGSPTGPQRTKQTVSLRPSAHPPEKTSSMRGISGIGGIDNCTYLSPHRKHALRPPPRHAEPDSETRNIKADHKWRCAQIVKARSSKQRSHAQTHTHTKHNDTGSPTQGLW